MDAPGRTQRPPRPRDDPSRDGVDMASTARPGRSRPTIPAWTRSAIHLQTAERQPAVARPEYANRPPPASNRRRLFRRRPPRPEDLRHHSRPAPGSGPPRRTRRSTKIWCLRNGTRHSSSSTPTMIAGPMLQPCSRPLPGIRRKGATQPPDRGDAGGHREHRWSQAPETKPIFPQPV